MNAFIVSFISIVKRHIRSGTPLIMQVISPLIMIIIFAALLKGNFSTGSTLSPVKVAVVNEDNSQVSKQFTAFLNSTTLNNLIKVSSVKDLSSAKLSLQNNKYDGVIEVKSNYNEDYLQGKYDDIETFMLQNDKQTYQILSSILNGWKNNSAAIQLGIRSGKSMDSITAALQSSDKIITERPLSSNRNLPKAIDYCSVTMVVMTLIFSGFNALGWLKDDILSEMKLRFDNAPVHIGFILSGILFGTTLMSFLQSIIVVLFTHFIYGANWGSNWGVVLSTLFILTLFGQMFAGALALGMKNADAPQAIIGSAAMGLEFLAGGFYTSPIGGPVGKFLLTYGTPNSLAQTAIFGSIYGGSNQIILMCIGILTALAILFLMITITFARRRIL